MLDTAPWPRGLPYSLRIVTKRSVQLSRSTFLVRCFAGREIEANLGKLDSDREESHGFGAGLTQLNTSHCHTERGDCILPPALYSFHLSPNFITGPVLGQILKNSLIWGP